MTIIDANHYLEQLLSPAELDRIARDCQFCLRKRAITPAMLVTALCGHLAATRSMVSLDCTIISMPCNWLMPIRFLQALSQPVAQSVVRPVHEGAG
jgi:hypothetical protein